MSSKESTVVGCTAVNRDEPGAETLLRAISLLLFSRASRADARNSKMFRIVVSKSSVVFSCCCPRLIFASYESKFSLEYISVCEFFGNQNGMYSEQVHVHHAFLSLEDDLEEGVNLTLKTAKR